MKTLSPLRRYLGCHTSLVTLLGLVLTMFSVQPASAVAKTFTFQGKVMVPKPKSTCTKLLSQNCVVYITSASGTVSQTVSLLPVKTANGILTGFSGSFSGLKLNVQETGAVEVKVTVKITYEYGGGYGATASGSARGIVSVGSAWLGRVDCGTMNVSCQ